MTWYCTFTITVVTKRYSVWYFYHGILHGKIPWFFGDQVRFFQVLSTLKNRFVSGSSSVNTYGSGSSSMELESCFRCGHAVID